MAKNFGIFLQSYYKDLLLQTSYDLLTNFLWTSYEALTNLNEYLTNFGWTSYKLVMDILQVSYEFLTNFGWTSHILVMDILQFSYEFLTNFSWTSWEALTNVIQIYCNILQISLKLFTSDHHLDWLPCYERGILTLKMILRLS